MGLVVAIVAASGGLAAADEFKPPPMKDGLWETHTVQTQAGKNVADMSIKMCQSKEHTQSTQTLSAEMRKRNQCSSVVSQRSGGTTVEETRCAKGPSAGMLIKAIYSHVGDTAAHIEMHEQKGSTDDVTVMDLKYLGSCPAGMQAGDMIMSDGKVLSGGGK
ncbi:MAG TPA: DUF3617 family protein [Steroidobacteraceae bacterium]